MVILLLKCPHCGNQMKAMPKTDITRAKKQCVYCGKSFPIRGSTEKSAIIKIIKEGQ